MKSHICLVAAAALLLIPAQAEDCGKLLSYGAVPMIEIAGESSEFVPVEIGGVPKLMLLDTGAYYTMMSSRTADELDLKSTLANPVYDVTGAKSDRLVTTSLKIGNLRGDGIQFMLSTSSLEDWGDPRVAGLLGASILVSYDISIDFGAHTLTLISPKHCEGQAVYWPERPIAIIPFKLWQGGQIILPVTLDGREVKALLDTGASTSTLEKGKAERTFDLVLGSADTPVSIDLNGTKGLTTWKHRFKLLSLAGIDVANPEIRIIPDKIGEKVNTFSTGTMLDKKANSIEEPPMLLGMDVLEHLHIYIAYREKKLYITPASTPPAGGGGAN
jgi:predicted aspartyl protease